MPVSATTSRTITIAAIAAIVVVSVGIGFI